MPTQTNDTLNQPMRRVQSYRSVQRPSFVSEFHLEAVLDEMKKSGVVSGWFKGDTEYVVRLNWAE